MKNTLLLIISLFSTVALATPSKELSLKLLGDENKEEIAKELQVDSQKISIAPIAFEYEAQNASQSGGIYNRGKVYISWLVKNISSDSNIFSYTRSNISYTSQSPAIDGIKAGSQYQVIKIGYQLVESVALEATYEPSDTTIELVSPFSNTLLGKVTNNSFPGKIENHFESVRISVVGNLPIANSPTWRLDLVGGVNGSVIKLTSSYKTTGDIYNDAFGYGVGGELGIKITHRSGFFVTAGTGISYKTMAPYDLDNGAHIQFDAQEQYYFINIGFYF